MKEMEQNHVAASAPVVSKKLWRIVRVVYLMLRKGINKKKLLLDLNIMTKRGKAITKLLFPHHSSPAPHSFVAPHEYEFSCSNTPAYPWCRRNNNNNHHHIPSFFGCVHGPTTVEDDFVTVNKAVKVVLEMLNNESDVVEASPMLPGLGFGKSPMVRQLRITDSPFPLKDVDEDSGMVDKAAEDFIHKFYNNLKLQKKLADA